MSRAVFLVLLMFLSLAAPEGLAASDYPLWDVRGGERTTLSAALPEIAEADIVFAGERHGDVRDHQFQLAVARGLHESGVRVAVGLEMFRHDRQDVLDRWVAREISEREFIAEFRENWGELWLYYRPVFVYCREKGIPMVGLNVPREVTRKVAREGFGALTPEELGTLPPVACDLSPEYLGFLRRVLGGHENPHGGTQGPAFTRFCEAQAVWDAALAWHAVEYLRATPGTRMVVLCGGVHAWRPAAPTRVAAFSEKLRTLSILPLDEGEGPNAYSPADGDFLLLSEPEETH